MKEIFKDIPGFEGKYQASNLGNIKSINYNRTGEEKILKFSINRGGYSIIGLTKNGKKKTTTVHKFICLTFLGKNKGLTVNHKNGIKTDNRLENLEYCSLSYNIKHRFKVLGHIGLFGSNNGCYGKVGKLNPNSKKINQYDVEGNFIKSWDCILDASNYLGINYTNISNCISGRYKTSGGFVWKLLETKV